MLLIPAIDLKDGKCVRLKQGDMNDSTTFGEDPAAMARRWLDAGARRLHLVDLNGAFAGQPVNQAAINKELARAIGLRRETAPARVLANLDVPIDLVVVLCGFDDAPCELVARLLPCLRAGGSLVVPRARRRPRLVAAIDRHCAEDGPLQALQVPLDGGLLWSVKR